MKRHAFFAGVSWKALTDGAAAPPYVPPPREAAAGDPEGAAGGGDGDGDGGGGGEGTAVLEGDGTADPKRQFLVKQQSSTEYAWAKFF